MDDELANAPPDAIAQRIFTALHNNHMTQSLPKALAMMYGISLLLMYGPNNNGQQHRHQHQQEHQVSK
jgi:hypothetical protein